MILTVNTLDVRQALQSVIPHAADVKDSPAHAASGRLVKLFATAAAAYGEPLVIEPTEDARRILISCGESFLGILMPIRDEEVAGNLNAWREGWMRRLPEIAHAGGGTQPAPTPGADFLRNGKGFQGSVTVTSGSNVHDITEAAFNRVVEIVEPHL